MSTTPDPRMQGYQQPMNQEPVYERQPYGVDNNTVQSSNVGGAYSQSQHENYVDPQGNRVENRVEVFEDKNQSRANTRYWIKTITYFVLAVLEIILLLRLFFRLFGANQDNGFITFLYSLSHVFVTAFNGIFHDQTIVGHQRLISPSKLLPIGQVIHGRAHSVRAMALGHPSQFP